jgi:hypothetical protein
MEFFEIPDFISPAEASHLGLKYYHAKLNLQRFTVFPPHNTIPRCVSTSLIQIAKLPINHTSQFPARLLACIPLRIHRSPQGAQPTRRTIRKRQRARNLISPIQKNQTPAKWSTHDQLVHDGNKTPEPRVTRKPRPACHQLRGDCLDVHHAPERLFNTAEKASKVVCEGSVVTLL